VLPCFLASLLPCFLASLLPCFIALLLFFCFLASLRPCVLASLFSRFYASVLPCFCVSVLPCFLASVLPWCFHASMLLSCHGASVLLIMSSYNGNLWQLVCVVPTILSRMCTLSCLHFLKPIDLKLETKNTCTLLNLPRGRNISGCCRLTAIFWKE